MESLSARKARPTGTVGLAFFRLTYAMAILGGAVMSALALMIMVSVVGRALFNAPIYGDVEVVAVGTAIAVFLYLPYCQQKRGNVIVDLFLSHASERVRTLSDIAGYLIYGALAAVLTWRSVLGGLEMHQAGETSMILSIPTWYAFPFIVLSFGTLTLSCLLSIVDDLARLKP
jgi:TRAP-type C4-dicarboxylate transport system permease small subunit